jgi:signal transduction histidine kinase
MVFCFLIILLSGAFVWQTRRVWFLKKSIEQKTVEWQQRLQTKRRMITTLSHEVLAPLWMITTVVRREMESQLPDSTRVALEKIGRTADLLYHTSLSIITWMKYHANEQVASKEMVFPAQAAERVIDLMSYMAENKRVRIINMIPARIQLHTDRTLLQIILLNLLSNSIKFTAGGGEVAFYGWEKEGKVHIAVYDTGTGFRQDVLQQLRAHAGRHYSTIGTGGEPGHGVGYTTILYFLQRLGGSLVIENLRGKGAGVTVVLPKGFLQEKSHAAIYRKSVI